MVKYAEIVRSGAAHDRSYFEATFITAIRFKYMPDEHLNMCVDHLFGVLRRETSVDVLILATGLGRYVRTDGDEWRVEYRRESFADLVLGGRHLPHDELFTWYINRLQEMSADDRAATHDYFCRMFQSKLRRLPNSELERLQRYNDADIQVVALHA